MKHGSLFSGIGGFDLAFERAGFETLWQCEIDARASAVLAYHWPDVLRFEDVQWVHGANVDPVDVITFGSPCQDLSVAGRRAGLDGERSGLFFEATRIIREMREATNGQYPTFTLWENVPGAFSSNLGRDFGAVLDSLAALGALDIAWRVLDAQNFGVAQRRRRVFLVADFGGSRAGEILFEPEGVCGDPQTGGTPGQDVTVSLVPGAGQPRQDGPGDVMAAPFDERNITSKTNRSRVDYGMPSPTLAQRGMTIAIRTANTSSNGHGFSEELAHTLGGSSDAVYIPDITGALDTQRGGEKLALQTAANGHLLSTYWDGGQTSDTLDVSALVKRQTMLDKRHFAAVTVRAGVRRLTPTECERLQGFPDGWTDNGQADSHRYRQLGNAVAVPVAEWVANRIKEAMQ